MKENSLADPHLSPDYESTRVIISAVREGNFVDGRFIGLY